MTPGARLWTIDRDVDELIARPVTVLGSCDVGHVRASYGGGWIEHFSPDRLFHTTAIVAVMALLGRLQGAVPGVWRIPTRTRP